ELRGGEAWHRRALEVDRARHGQIPRALELHRALRLEPHDRLDPGRDAGPASAGGKAERHADGEDCAAGGLSSVGGRTRGERADLWRARELYLPHVAVSAAAHGALLGRLVR